MNVTPTDTAFLGEVKVFNLDIIIQPDSNNYLLVKFMSPINESGIMEICNANVVRVGGNLPCIKRGGLDAVFEPR